MSGGAFAQNNNFLLLGRLEGASGQGILLEIDKKYLNNTKEEYRAEVNADGRFGFVAMLEFPQTVVLRYRGKSIELYAAPGDTLELSGEAETFPHPIIFKHNLAFANDCWRQYKQQFAPDVPLFEQVNYKKGIYYYQLHDALDSTMRHTSDTAFLAHIQQEKTAAQALLISSKANTNATFSQFMKASIDYNYWQQRLAYGHIYRYRHRLDSSYFFVFDTLRLSADALLGNAAYRRFMMAFLNYKYEHKVGKLPTTPEILEGQYALAKELYQNKTQYFALAYLVEKALQTEFLERVAPLYEDFLKTNPYLELDRIVADAFQQVRPFAEGTPAPNFFLQDTLGNGIGLRDFQGKTIYLGFWASWCRPCMQKMQELEGIKANLAEKNIVFVHVSLDRETEQWRETIAKKGFTGVHLLAASSSITRDYKVLSVPKFFIITKDGNFAQMPVNTDLEGWLQYQLNQP